MSIRVLLVDDQPLLRMGFRMILEAQPDIDVVGEADDGAAGVALARSERPDVVLMDVRMPVMDGIEATAAIRTRDSEVKVLILTTFDLDEYVLAGLRGGANGFLLKDIPPQQLLDAIRAVASGDSIIAPSATRRLLDKFVPMIDDSERRMQHRGRLDTLTEREQEVFGLLALGRSNREIAEELHLSEGTVKVHVGRILSKLELRDRVQAVVLAYEAGIVTPGSSPL